MTNEEFIVYKKEIVELLNPVKDLLSIDLLRMVEHYLSYNEIEMAFELFCLELMRLNIDLPSDKKKRIKNLAKQLKLDELTVYEPNFWEMLSAY